MPLRGSPSEALLFRCVTREQALGVLALANFLPGVGLAKAFGSLTRTTRGGG